MLISYLIQAAAVLLLSLGMLKHFRDAFARPLRDTAAIWLKLISWLLLIGAFYSAMHCEHQALMSVYWLCFLSINIVAVALIHSKLARR